MKIIVELYVCESCQHVELENGPCPKCEGDMECIDFIPVAGDEAGDRPLTNLVAGDEPDGVYHAIACELGEE